MARRSRTKPVAAHIEKAETTSSTEPVTPAEVTTTPEPVVETAPPAETPVETLPPVETEGDIFDQAITSRQAGQFEQPDTDIRIEAAMEAAPVMRGSELEEPTDVEQDGTGPNRWAGVFRDSKHKLRIDKETVRKPGHPYLRVLISFPKDAKPNEEERRLLKDERFGFDGESWYKELTGANVLLAKQVVNQIYKMRGDEYQLLV